MSSLSMVEGKLPAGFRFHPRDDELICDYLMNKLLLISPIPNFHSGFDSDAFALLIDVDLNKCEPWDLPEIACIGGKEWYFYSQRDRKYATGLRTNRATVSGYWKATGKDRAVVRKGGLVGMRKTLVFYQGRAPKGRKTDWVMHEFRLEGPFAPAPKSSPSQEDWVLCRVFHKSRESFPPKQNPTGYDETASSSLPALTESYINSDADNENVTLPDYQQVPCFSQQLPFGAFGNTLINHNNVSFGSESARDRHVIKEVLSHLTNNMDNGSEPELKGSSKSRILGNNIGDEEARVSHSETYLSDVMWTSHY